MLVEFVVKRTFNKLVAKVYVDLETSLAEITLTYDRLYKGQWDVNLTEVATPDLADRYLSKPMGEHGSFMETLEHQFRHKWGVGAPSVAEIIASD